MNTTVVGATSFAPAQDSWESLRIYPDPAVQTLDPRFDSPEERFKNRHVVDEMLSEWTIQYDKLEVMRRLGEQGIPAGAVMDTMELSNDPDLNRREIFVTVKHPVRGDFKMPGWPVKMSGSKVPITAAPLLGADTEAVYSSLLGLSVEEIAALREEKAI